MPLTAAHREGRRQLPQCAARIDGVRRRRSDRPPVGGPHQRNEAVERQLRRGQQTVRRTEWQTERKKHLITISNRTAHYASYVRCDAIWSEVVSCVGSTRLQIHSVSHTSGDAMWCEVRCRTHIQSKVQRSSERVKYRAAQCIPGRTAAASGPRRCAAGTPRSPRRAVGGGGGRPLRTPPNTGRARTATAPHTPHSHHHTPADSQSARGTVLHCITLHYKITLHCIALHYITWHDTTGQDTQAHVYFVTVCTKETAPAVHKSESVYVRERQSYMRGTREEPNGRQRPRTPNTRGTERRHRLTRRHKGPKHEGEKGHDSQHRKRQNEKETGGKETTAIRTIDVQVQGESLGKLRREQFVEYDKHTGADRAGQDSTPRHRTRQRSRPQHTTRHHGTAHHTTPWHGTPHDIMAQ